MWLDCVGEAVTGDSGDINIGEGDRDSAGGAGIVEGDGSLPDCVDKVKFCDISIVIRNVRLTRSISSS